MKKLISKVFFSVGGALALIGINTPIINADIKTQQFIDNVDKLTPLYLEHGKAITTDTDDMLTWHTSHRSHQSHYSHSSHQSHYSHYSSSY